MTHVFVVPDPAAMVSGGNVYNASLLAALRAAGARVIARERAEASADDGADARYWIDSLYLEALPRLRQAGRRVHLIAHYLPSLVELGSIPAPAQLSPAEQAALAAADGFLVPSPFMAGVLAQLGAAPRPVLVVAPGLVASPSSTATPARARDAAVHAIVVANVVPGKRVLPFLDALAPSLRAGARLHVTVAGSLEMDRAYARACRERVASDPALAAAVRFVGPLAHAELLERVAASDLLVSPSGMESFGLALAEARALGVPIVARDGGNSAAHVEPRAGGVLADSDEAVARACVALAADRDELARRRAAARAARPAPRDWADAARDFLAAQREDGNE